MPTASGYAAAPSRSASTCAPGSRSTCSASTCSEKLDSVKPYLPDDLVIVPTSDQPVQVKEQIDLFMDALYEAIGLVVIVSLIGFWEWRSALLMAISIPITLAMTFGIIYVLGIDIQQVSVASLIIALGLLVDDPVVAGDSIKRMLAEGQPRIVAPWLGPTKIATAIMYATITNIVAYLPFLMITGTTGEFIYSLPIVMTVRAVCLASGLDDLHPAAGLLPSAARQEAGSAHRGAPHERLHRHLCARSPSSPSNIAGRSPSARWRSSCSVRFLFSQLKTSFFPDDVQYWSYVDVWLPNDANFDATNQAAQQVETIIRRAGRAVRQDSIRRKTARPSHILKYVTTWVGGGSPRFWFSVSPQAQAAELRAGAGAADRQGHHAGVRRPGAAGAVRQSARRALRLSPAADQSHQLSGRDSRRQPGRREHQRRARRTSPRCAASPPRSSTFLQSAAEARRVRNEWEKESFQVQLNINPDRANLAGITNLDVANSATSALSGTPVTTLQDGDKNIPVVARLQMDERSKLSDIQNLYVYSSSSQNGTKVPLVQISDVSNSMMTDRIVRIDHFREMSIYAFPAPGHLASEITSVALPKLARVREDYAARLQDHHRRRVRQAAGRLPQSRARAGDLGLGDLSGAALPVQQRHQAVAGLRRRALRRGRRHHRAVGHEAPRSASWRFSASPASSASSSATSSCSSTSSRRCTPKASPSKKPSSTPASSACGRCMITVSATVLALFPLAMHGGPLWQPLCYAQIGGLTVATFITLLMVPVLYSIFVLDLKILTWERKKHPRKSKRRPRARARQPPTHRLGRVESSAAPLALIGFELTPFAIIQYTSREAAA